MHSSKYKFGSDELLLSFKLKNDEVKFSYQTIAEPNFHSFLYCVFQSILQAQTKIGASELLEMSHSILSGFGGEIELESTDDEEEDEERDEDEEEEKDSASSEVTPVNGWKPYSPSTWNSSDYPKYSSSIKDVKTYITSCFDDDDKLVMRVLSYDSQDEDTILQIIGEYFPASIKDLNLYSIREARELDSLSCRKARSLYYKLRKLGAIVAIRSLGEASPPDISPDIDGNETLVIEND